MSRVVGLTLMAVVLVTFGSFSVLGNTFIWDPTIQDSGAIELVRPPFSASGGNQRQTFANPPVCLPIPANLTLCHGIKYSQMRLPNLLYHETLNEVIEQSNSWIQLIKIGCHPDTQLFLCSLFSPVCLDQTIPPCRSLCEHVQQSCEPSMLRHGFSWPPMMQCNLFPVDNNMCIESQQVNQAKNIGVETPVAPSPAKPVAKPEIQNATFNRQLMEAICNSDWVIKIGLNQMRGDRVRVKKYKNVSGSFALEPPFTMPINRSVIITESPGATVIKPREKFVVMGRGHRVGELAVQLAVSWLKNTGQIKQAIRMSRTVNGCKKYLISSNSAGPKRPRNRNRKKNSNGGSHRISGTKNLSSA